MVKMILILGGKTLANIHLADAYEFMGVTCKHKYENVCFTNTRNGLKVYNI